MVEIARLDLTEAVNAGGRSEYKFFKDKPSGLRMHMTEHGVCIEQPGHKATTAHWSVVKSTMAHIEPPADAKPIPRLEVPKPPAPPPPAKRVRVRSRKKVKA